MDGSLVTDIGKGSQEKNILYDLLLPVEWPEITNILNTEKGLSYLWQRIANSVHAFLQSSLDRLRHPIRYLSSFSSPSTIVRLLNAKLPWKLAITSDGLVLAVLKDEVIEIRSILDDFERVNTTIPVGKDACAQWRQLLWSEDGYVLAMANSCGEVHLFSPSGKYLGHVGRVSLEDSNYAGSLTQAVAAMVFIPPQTDRHSQDVQCLLNVLFYDGTLETYEIRTNSEPVHVHSYSFSSYFPEGLSAMTYVSKHNLLLVGGSPYLTGEGVACGISGWRLLDAPPYWGPRLGQQIEKISAGGLRRLFLERKKSRNLEGTVFSMCLSPSSSVLAVIDLAGSVTLWDIPSLRHKATFDLNQLPVRQSGAGKQGRPVPLEVSWWNEEALVIVNEVGEVSVLSTATLRDLLGNAPLCGWSITPTHNQQFFLLKCDMSQRRVVRRFRVPSLSMDGDGEEEEEEDQEDVAFSLSRFSSDLVKQVLYYITDSERFRPSSKKKLKYQAVSRKYSLACMKAITPAECYERMLVRGDYVEALELAREYELDSDQVHQRQWLSYQVSISTIQDYLAKVSKLWWVLQECLSCVTSDFETTRQLLKYGLSRTSFRELKNLADLQIEPSGKDTERMDGEECQQEDEEDRGQDEEEEGGVERVVEEQGEDVEEVVKELAMVERLSVDQVSLCQYRHMMFCHLDRLETYQVIADQARGDAKLFDWRTYERFRSENLVRSAIDYARDSNSRALETLFTYHGDVTLPHRLAILSNFPETTPPSRYGSLLPEIGVGGELMKWTQKNHRTQDWVESEVTKKLCSLPDDRRGSYGDFIYDGNSQWMQYLRADSMETIRTWYINRAAEIEEFSGQVDCAMGLIELGCDKGIVGMTDVLHELKTLHTLVYECGADSRLSWKKLKSLSDLEVVQLMMKETEVSETDFVGAMETRVVPFLSRQEAMKTHGSRGLLKDYLKILSKMDLTPCLLVLRQSNEVLDGGEDSDGSCQQPIIPLITDRMDVAITCIHTCERSDQVGVAKQIISCLPTREADSAGSSELHDNVDALENYISAANTLKLYQVLKPIRYIKSVQENPAEAKQLLVMLTRVASRRTPAMSVAGWWTLLHHLLSLRHDIFRYIDVVTCYKIYTESLLCSGMESNIQLAVRHLTLDPTSSSSSSSSSPPQLLVEPAIEGDSAGITVMDFKLSYDTSVDLVVGAAKEYFNSAANLMDADMDLARCCLSLFPYPGPRVQAELNLIASLALLDDFQLPMLPVQVRLCENKLDIVRNILDSAPSAYKRHDKIVRLCRLLAVTEETESVDSGEVGAWQGGPGMGGDQGHALILVILTALEKRDYRLALELTSQLMSAQFPPAWEVCRVMGLNPQLGDLETRKRMLDFSITHCPPEDLISLLQSKKLLHLQSQLSKCGVSDTTTSLHSSGSRERRGVAGDGGGHGLVGKSVQLVSRGAGAVQSWMKPGATAASQSSVLLVDVDKEVEQVVMEGVVKLREHASRLEESRRGLGDHSVVPHGYTHPFYHHRNTQPREESWKSKSEETRERQVQSLQALLHFYQMALDLSMEDQFSTHCTDVSLKLAELLCDKDIHLVVGHLLDIHEGDNYKAWLSRVSPAQFSLELVLYCVALQLYTVTISMGGAPGQDEALSDVYQATPEAFLSHVTSSVKSCDLQGRWSEEQKPWVFLLEQYQQMLMEHNQSVTLLDLGLGIDVDQFAKDEEYRRSIITSLARSSDEKIFSTALSQAHRHGVDLWEVHLSLLESLLTTSSWSIDEIERKLDDRQVVSSILTDPQKSLDYLKDTVYPELSGKKLDRLFLYYTIIQQCVDHGAQLTGIKNIDVDIKVLEKLKLANIKDVDYKELMSGEGDPLLLLLPSLTSSNIHMVADVAGYIPCGQSAVLTSGMVLCGFALKLFWTGQKSTTKSSAKDCLKRLKKCEEFLCLLSPAQLQHFILGIALSKKSLQLSVDIRCQLVKACVKFCQDNILYQTSDGSKKDKMMSQEELMSLLNKYLQHLTNLKEELLKNDGSVPEDDWEKFKTNFDLSLSEPDEVSGLVVTLIKCGASPECVEGVMRCALKVHSAQSSPPELYQEALQQVLKSVSSSSQESESGSRQDADSVRMIFSAVSEHETKGGSVVMSKDLVSVMTPFCKDKSNPLHLRKLWFSLIEQHLFLSEDDHHLLLYHHTLSLLEDVFPIEQVSVADISSPAGQKKLFADLLGVCGTEQQHHVLCSLLECWSEAGSSSVLMECWVDMLKFLAARSGRDSFQEVLLVRAGLTDIPADVDEDLVQRADCPVSALKYSLLCGDRLFDKTFLKEKEVPLTEVDGDLLELLLLKKKVLQLRVSQHPLYRLLHDRVQDPSSGPAHRSLFAKLLGCSESEVDEKLCILDRGECVKEFARQLYEGGFSVEAGALLVAASGFHRELATVTDSLSYVRSLFTK